MPPISGAARRAPENERFVNIVRRAAECVNRRVGRKRSILNGRKVTRQVLNDGDIVTIGDIQFRYVAKPLGAAVKE